MTELHKTLAEYCMNNVWEFDIRSRLAITRIDRERAPLRMVDSCLYTDILDAIEEWGADHDTDVEDVDAEDLIFITI